MAEIRNVRRILVGKLLSKIGAWKTDEQIEEIIKMQICSWIVSSGVNFRLMLRDYDCSCVNVALLQTLHHCLFVAGKCVHVHFTLLG
jgi:hypothetical protein